MDFVQRNLINERNNLQVELAKAKILIAQLNESKVQGLKDVIQNAHANEGNLSVAGAQLAASATEELRKMGESSHNDKDHHFKNVKPFELSEQAEYISDLENVIVTIAESINVSAADLYETYRITPARRALLDKIQSTAMRDAADAMGPDGEDFRASSIKKSDAALSRISRIELMKMKGKPSDKRTHDQHPMHRFFPDDRSPNQLTDRALNADLAAERKREISNRPKKKNKNFLNESVEQQIRAVKKAEKVVFKNAAMDSSNLASATSVMGIPVSVNTGVVANATHPTVANSMGNFRPDGMLVNVPTAKNLRGLFTDPDSRTTLRHELAHATQFAVQDKRGRINPSLPNLKLREPKIIPSGVSDLSGANYSNNDLEMNARAISSAVDANRQHKKQIRKHLAAGLSLQDAKHAARTSMLNKHMSLERTGSRNIIDTLMNQDTEFVPNNDRMSERLPKIVKKLIYGSPALTRKLRSDRGEQIIKGLSPIASDEYNSILPAGSVSNKDRTQRVSKAIMYGAKGENKVRKAISRGLQMAEKDFKG